MDDRFSATLAPTGQPPGALPLLPPPPLPSYRNGDDAEAEPPVLGSATLAVWVSCLLIGVLGLKLHYPSPPAPPAAPPAPVVVENMRVELAGDPTPPTIGPAPPESAAPSPAASPPDASVLQPPASPDLSPVPDAPPLTDVASPSAKLAFAVPVEGPTRTVDAGQAGGVAPPSRQQQPAPTPAPAGAGGAPGGVQHLTFGVGQGQQPAPGYPRESVLAHEQGTVVVRFTVGTDGRVLSADVSQACRWPLLNRAALQAVRERWRFPPGPVRTFDVPIEFQLNTR